MWIIAINFCLIPLQQIWDPFTNELVRQLDSARYLPVTAMAALPAPSAQIITATNEATLKLVL